MSVDQPYVRDGDRILCKPHNTWFESTGSCASCDADPGHFDPTEDVDEPLPDPPAGTWSSLDYERGLLAEVEVIRVRANEMAQTKVKSRMAASTAAKLWDTYLKGMRLLIHLSQNREHEEIQRAREKRDRRRRAGAHH